MPALLFQVDAFTDRPFAGNPAGVCLPTEPPDATWMQNVASEMNLSETAFLWRRADGAFDLRWFTPVVEVALCGHATLASAHVLWERGHLAPTEQARFHTLSGLLSANRQGDWIELNLPAEPATPVPAPEGLTRALGTEVQAVLKNRFDYLVELPSESVVRTLKVDLALLRDLDTRGLIVTSLAAPPFDFVSRFFAPWVGVAEDPVTGSAHCCLGPYWAERTGRREFHAYQASARGGVLRVRVDAGRVFIAGQAVTVFSGQLQC